ncbi:MAG: MqnA/MqnD/SBP family protein [Candidatus Kapaibacterium sp.]
MKRRIIVPENPMFARLIANIKTIQEKFDIDIYSVEESQVEKLMFSNRADVALTTPITYGRGMDRGDFRIVPTRCFVADGYAGIASIYFNQGLKSIGRIGTPDPDGYIALVSDVLLKERYDIHAKFGKISGDAEDALAQFDAAVVPGTSLHEEHALDLSEEWAAAYEMPLPVGIWVCRNEEAPSNTVEIVEALAEDNLPAREKTGEKTSEEYLDREGSRIFRMNEEIEKSIDFVLQMFYYHQYLPEIPAVKLLGRD